MRVLLVEDDPMIAKGLQTALRQDGYTVDSVSDGRRAAEALRTPSFDIVLLDLGLPGRDGLEVTDSGPGIPAADRKRVFDRFYRRASAAEGGSGLGLAIVKAIADRHGAEVTLADAPGGRLQVTVGFARRT
jgi:signal transduction histidine kinase